MIDITGGNVAPLKATLMREGERFPVADAQDLAVALVSQSGRKTVLGAGEYRTDIMEEGVLYADGPATLTPGHYGLEVKGWMNGTPWRTYAPSVLKVTYATAPGGEQAAVSGDDGDIVMEVQLYAMSMRTIDGIQQAIDECEAAADSANDAAQAANTAAQGAENVDAELNGTLLTVTNRQGVSQTVDTQGEKGDTGDTFFATFEVNEDMDLVMTRYERDSLSMEVVDGYLYEVVA